MMHFTAPPPPPPPPPPMTATPSNQELQFDSAGNNSSTCIAFLQNCCQNGNRCRFVHRHDKAGIIFCKEFFNSSSCKKPTCRFIHATAVEQKAYKEKNIILPSLQNRINTVENINNLLTQLNSAPQWPPKNSFNHIAPPPPPPATISGVVNNYNNHGSHSSVFSYASPGTSSQPMMFPINTSIPPPNYAHQLGYSHRIGLSQPPPPIPNNSMNYHHLWSVPVNQPPPPIYEPENGPSPAKKTADYNIRCQKCCYNQTKLKQSNAEVEQLMQEHADLDLHYSKLQNLFQELRAGALLIMRDCENPEIKSLLKTHLNTCEPTEESVELQPDRVNNYNYQSQKYQDQVANNGWQQKLAHLICGKTRTLNQLKAHDS